MLPSMTVVSLSGQVANIWKNTKKNMVWGGSKIHTQKISKIVLDWSKIHTHKMVKQNGRGLSRRVCHKHTQKMMFK